MRKRGFIFAMASVLLLGGALMPSKQSEAAAYVRSNLSPAQAKVIVIDPGHCGKHTGATANGLREEQVVLDISKACQSALNQYGDVTVYMTREDGGCCENLGLGSCLAGRNNYAKRLDADFLVSMHINSGASSGANVLTAYDSGYNKYVTESTQRFGNLALQNLAALGVANRGLLLRRSESGNRYSNGSLADYYSIVRNGVLQNIPSVIIEHGYVTSASDCFRFFSTQQKRYGLGYADAKSIISYYGLHQPATQGRFVYQGGAYYFLGQNGQYVTGWIKNNGAWYYVDPSTGKLRTGWLKDGNTYYYLSPSNGKMQTGWFAVNGSYYLAKGNGAIVMNQTYSDGMHTYLFNAQGKQIKNQLCNINGNTYYVNREGRLVTGIVAIGRNYYGFDDEGRMLKGVQRINGNIYCFDNRTGAMIRNRIILYQRSYYYFGTNGVRATGLIRYGSNYYFFNTRTGRMHTGWLRIGRYLYYFNTKTGQMERNKWIGNYYVNQWGIMTRTK